jgi:VWFA-related protein
MPLRKLSRRPAENGPDQRILKPRTKPSKRGLNWRQLAVRCGLACLLFALVALAPRWGGWLIDRVHDRDRSRFEATVLLAERAGNWPEAAQMVGERLRRPLSAGWRMELERRRFEALLQAGVTQTEPSASRLLAEAQELAAARNVGTAVVEAIEQGKRDQRALNASQAALDRETAERKQAEARLAAVELERSQTSAALREAQTLLTGREAALRTLRTAQEQLSRAAKEAAASHVAALSAWAGTLREQAERARPKYEEALRVAQQFSLPAQQLEQELAALKLPADPTPGTALRIIGEHQTAATLKLDVAAVAAGGRDLVGLSRQDFRVLVGDEPWERWTVEPVTWTQEHAIAICLDTSGSMQGAAFQAATSAVRALPDSFPSARFELVTFSDTVRVPLEWSSNKQLLDQAVAQLKPAGGTALYAAIERAAQDIASMPGKRTIVVCSDGRDSVAGVTLSQAIERCQAAEAAVHVISLETKESDPIALQEIAGQTGGSVVTASDPAQLATAFQAVARDLRRPAYRFTILDRPPGEPVRIRLGVNRPEETTYGKSAARRAIEAGATK